MRAASQEAGVPELEDYYQKPHDRTVFERGIASLDFEAIERTQMMCIGRSRLAAASCLQAFQIVTGDSSVHLRLVQLLTRVNGLNHRQSLAETRMQYVHAASQRFEAGCGNGG